MEWESDDEVVLRLHVTGNQYHTNTMWYGMVWYGIGSKKYGMVWYWVNTIPYHTIRSPKEA